MSLMNTNIQSFLPLDLGCVYNRSVYGPVEIWLFGFIAAVRRMNYITISQTTGVRFHIIIVNVTYIQCILYGIQSERQPVLRKSGVRCNQQPIVKWILRGHYNKLYNACSYSLRSYPIYYNVVYIVVIVLKNVILYINDDIIYVLYLFYVHHYNSMLFISLWALNIDISKPQKKN